MKRIFSLLLVVCMLITSCIAFTACSKVSEKDVEKDPQAVLQEAIGNSGTAFFEDDNNKQLGDIITKALENGSLSLVIESNMLKDEIGVGKITETLYMNTKDQRAVSDTVVNYDGEDLSARIFLDKNGVMLNSESILGNTNTYALYPANIADKFATSGIATMLGLTPDTMPEEFTSILGSVKGSWEASFANMDPEKAAETANALLAVLKQTTETKKVENAEGKEVKCVVISYEITNQTIKDFVNKYLELSKMTDQSVKDAANETLAELDAMGKLEGSLRIDINQKTNSVEGIFLNIEFRDREDDSILTTYHINARFGEKEISFKSRMREGDFWLDNTIKLTKTVADDAVTYKMTATTTDSEDLNETPFTATYVQKNDGNFTLNATVTEDEDEKSEFAINGKLTVNKNDATIAITSIKSGDITVEINASLTFKAEAEIPAAPSNAKDVMELTETEIQTIVADFQNSKLGKLIFGAIG